ncbi:MAG TPA: nuclear transport factor 2 family protein [Pyrinomonadaceae bacterium]|nr:nuclear transport factor 2 family protein [Pyrinomonadaceae bacterium]
MKRTLALTAALLLLAIVSAGRTKKDEASIRKIMDDQAAAWNRGDIDTFMAGYWKSDKLQFVGTDSVTKGWQATTDRYKRNYNSREKMGTLSFTDVEFIPISKDAAFIVMSWSLKRTSDNPHGKSTLLWRKLKEGWRIVVDHSS